MTLKIATSQFPVSSNIESNLDNIIKQTKQAKDRGCGVIHFPEGSLSGYAGVDFQSFKNYNWDLLKESTNQILSVAKEVGIWVLLGSSHQLSNPNKPHNCLYIINSKGNLIDRYDKLFCAGDITNETSDLKHYISGDHFSTFEINGVNCGVLICHDYRYPELYRELKKKEVQLVFHSYHAGNMDKERQEIMEKQVGKEYAHLNFGTTYPEITMPATMVSNAANNYMWISCSNTSAKESCWASFVVRPDGVIIGKLDKNKNDILVTEIDIEKDYYDSTKHWRKRAMDGKFYSGNKIVDVRSNKRTEL